MKSDFNERRENRKARYEDLAIKNVKESESRFKTVNDLSNLMNGQPILIGHHSEGRHRRDIEKMHNNMRKSVEADKKAANYVDRVANLDKDTAIYSDDPEAIVKLKKKIVSLERSQDMMKLANKIIKSKKEQHVKIDLLITEVKLTEQQAFKLMEPDYCGRIGFASYSLTNNNANLNRNKKRLAQLVKQESEETKEFEINGVKVVDNVEDNRLQLFFDGKPSDEVRTDLKSKGFRWSRYNGCWQTHRSNWANQKANDLLKSLA